MSAPRTLLFRLRALFRRNRLEADMDAELRQHLDFAFQENLARGLNEDEARRQALLEAGGLNTGPPDAAWWDLLLRLTERSPRAAIVHIPHVLWHRREDVERPRRLAPAAVSDAERSVVQAHLDRISALDGKLKSYITVLGEAALAAAKAAEAAVTSGGTLGPLHGVPVGLKDLYCTKGVRTTGGSKILADWVPAEDATVVARLRSAGAIVLGKTNTPELTLGFETVNPVYGRTSNPYDRSRTCGGSSGCCGRPEPRCRSGSRPPWPPPSVGVSTTSTPSPRTARRSASFTATSRPRTCCCPTKGASS